MKKLTQFLLFNHKAFFNGKTLVFLGQSTKNENGVQITKCDLVIAKDKTPYELNEGEIVSNVYEKLLVKVYNKNISIPVGTEVQLINPECKVWGEFRNQLSVVAEDIVPVTK